MKKLLLAAIFTAAPAAAQTTARAPVSGVNMTPGLGATPMPTVSPGLPAQAQSALALTPILAPVPVQPALAAGIHAAANEAQKTAINARGVKAALAMQASRTDREGRYRFTVNMPGSGHDFKKIEDLFEMDSEGWSYAGIPADIQLRGTPVDPAALAAQGPNEFSQAPAWFEVSQLKFDALIKSGTGGTAVLRYGWRSQYEMSVFAFPGSASISFKEHAANPLGSPKRSFEAALETATGRKAAAKLLRDAQERNPVSGKDKAALDEILAFLEGN